MVLPLLVRSQTAQRRILGNTWSLGGITRFLLYLAGFTIEILVISAIYFFLSA